MEALLLAGPGTLLGGEACSLSAWPWVIPPRASGSRYASTHLSHEAWQQPHPLGLSCQACQARVIYHMPRGHFNLRPDPALLFSIVTVHDMERHAEAPRSIWPSGCGPAFVQS